MAKQQDLDKAYMACAYAMAKLSQAARMKVGAILVSPLGGIIAEGFNGTPSGFDNCCETEHVGCVHQWQTNCAAQRHECTECDAVFPMRVANPRPDHSVKLVTVREVLHAESNAIAKVAKSTNSSEGATLYVTCSPCFDCAKIIIQAGIGRVVYDEEYRILDGIGLLRRANITVDRLGGD